MKSLHTYLIFILLLCTTSGFAQKTTYEVKVILDSVKNVKGTLQKVSADGIAVKDARGNYYIFKAKNIVKIKVRNKGLNFIESLGTGTGIGLAAGGVIISVAHSSRTDLAIAIGVGLTTVGAIGGALGGLLAQAINTQLILNLHSDTEKYKKSYSKLEKYLQ